MPTTATTPLAPFPVGALVEMHRATLQRRPPFAGKRVEILAVHTFPVTGEPSRYLVCLPGERARSAYVLPAWIATPAPVATTTKEPAMPVRIRKLTAEELAALDAEGAALDATNGHAPAAQPEPAPAPKKRGRPKKKAAEEELLPFEAGSGRRDTRAYPSAAAPPEVAPSDSADWIPGARGGPTDDPELQQLREDFYPEAYAPPPPARVPAPPTAEQYAALMVEHIDAAAEIKALEGALLVARLAREELLDQLTGLAYDWLAATRGSELWMRRYSEIADALTDAIDQRNSAEETVRRLSREQPAPRTLTITVNL